MKTIREAIKGMNGATRIMVTEPRPGTRDNILYYGPVSKARAENHHVLDRFYSEMTLEDDKSPRKFICFVVAKAPW